MKKINLKTNLKEGLDCRKEFKAAYQNRYTWEKDFPGYQGSCSWSDVTNKTTQGSFIVDKNLKVIVNRIQDPQINKMIHSQLWEVAIHRVRRTFEETHGANTFKSGFSNEYGTEVIVGGKNQGDKYRIKNDVINMVHRHIHGSLIRIFTEEILMTENGYLSKKYTSQYLDPKSDLPLKNKNIFKDDFEQIESNGTWVLRQREIEEESNDENIIEKQKFNFFNIKQIDYKL